MELSKVECMYLKRIYEVSVEDKRRVTSYDLAKFFGVRTPSSIDVLERLQRKGLVYRESWGPVVLTDEGLKLARKLFHAHRLLEVFFVQLGLPADIACEEAAKFDHLISDEVVERLCNMMGRPAICPHGRSILHEHR